MKKHLKLAACIGAAVSITACTAGQTGPPTQTTVSPVVNGNSKLSLAVGTANIAGQATLGLNVVPLYRQKDGASAVLVDTPKLTGAFTLPSAAGTPDTSGAFAQYDANSTAETGPSSTEIAGKFIEGSPQSGQIGTPSKVNSTFGTNGGVFGNGFAPGNYGTSGSPASYTPYYQPFYAGTGGNAFIPTASAPAFDPAGNGHGPTGPNYPENGLSLGLNVFQGVTPGAGSYTLSVSIQTTGSTLSPTPASATLTNAAFKLPLALTSGLTPAVAFNGDGSISVTNVAVTSPVVGAYVEVIDTGATDTTASTAKNTVNAAGCNGASASTPVYYTAWVTATGSVTIPNSNAPYGQTTAVCTAAQNAAALNSSSNTDVYTGDNVQVVVIGFDYNEYALQYHGKNGAAYPQAPALPAQADSSISESYSGPSS